uniref:Low-density lipoprotein receptor-related protein 4-like n=1 Tax=Saccoglossus kowalevskii TaxID=10224 RepID=A0ABM0MI51_SACKO|nr:PREDICTED: low-density lipoprotein receptor-related protein 4-like [Saccoglossus kowalevskii]
MFLEGDGQEIYDEPLPSPFVFITSNALSMRSLDYDYEEETVFWTDAHTKTVYKTVMQSGNLMNIAVYSGTSSQAEGLAVDWISKKLYWTDALYNWIMVSDYSGTYVKPLLLHDLDRPRGIVVHPNKGLIVHKQEGPQARASRKTVFHVKYFSGANSCGLKGVPLRADNKSKLRGSLDWDQGL